MEFLRRHKGKLVASLLITLGMWLTLHKGGLKIVPEGSDFGAVRWWTVPGYFVTLLGFAWFRSVRWRFLLRGVAEVPKARLFAVSCVGFAAILLMPFRIGEFVRPYMIRTPPEGRKSAQKVISMTTATSSIVVERATDGLYLSIVLAMALIFVPHLEPLPDKVVGIPVSVEYVRRAGFAMLGFFGAIFATLAVFYFARSWAHRMTFLVVGKVSRKLAEKVAGTAEKFADGMHVLARGRDAWGFFLETSLYWGLNAAGMWLLAWGSGVVHADGSAVTFGEACAFMGMLGCAILVPGPPGLLGPFQAGIYAAMTMYYPTSVVVGSGAAYVFLVYVSQFVFQIVAAGFGMLWLKRHGMEGGLRALEQAALDVAPTEAQ